MNCKQIKNYLLESFGEENIPAELKEHLKSCSECEAYYHELIALAEFTGSDEDFGLSSNEIEDLVDSINVNIDQLEVKKETNVKSIWLNYVPVAAAVVLLLGLSWMGGMFNGSGNLSSGNGLTDSILMASNDTKFTEDVSGNDMAYLINDYSTGVTTADADLVVDEITDEEYEYLAQNFDVGDIL